MEKNSMQRKELSNILPKNWKYSEEKTHWNFKKLSFWLKFVAAQSQKTHNKKACVKTIKIRQKKMFLQVQNT